MSALVLCKTAQIDMARKELRSRELSCIEPNSLPLRIGRRLGIVRRPVVGDRLKSWDVLQTVRFVEQHVPPDMPVLDIGAYASEIPCILHRLGYQQLAGADLHPGLDRMPYADRIRYVVSDFLATPFENQSFTAITAISVIEHGFRPEKLLAECGRLLHPGGYFIASFDYWPEKIYTSGVSLFGMDWRIFSRDEVEAFVRQAELVGFKPVGPLNLEVEERVIHWGGFDYTFAWLALRLEAG